jgi:RHS repeat-associated protein
MALLTLLLIVMAGSASAQLPSSTNMNLYDSGAQPGRLSGGAMLPPAAFPGSERPEIGSVQMSLPLVHLPGRGLGVDVNLNYNGALYRQAVENNKLIIKENSLYARLAPFPANGFVMGYGMLIRHSDYFDCWNQQNGPCPSECPLDPRIELSDSNIYTFVDSTGSTHRLVGAISTDGSDLRLDSANRTITYPDGTKIYFTSMSQQESAFLVGQGGRDTRFVCNNMASCTRICNVYDRVFYATKVVDRNGNTITITYATGAAPIISKIKDTMGREVRFVYDSTNNVTSIRVPGYQTDTEREVARLYYKTMTRVHSFANQPTTTQQVRVIDYVYLSGLRAGWHFDYSSYAQIYRVEKRAGMFADPVGGALTDAGSVVARTEYNYEGSPLNPATNLNGHVPSFTTRKDDWSGNPFGELTHTFDYVYSPSEHRAYVTVTAPDGTATEVKRGLYNGWEHNTDWRNTWDEGLVYQEKVFKQNKTYAQAAFEWEFTNGGPRLKSHTATNDAGQQKRTEYAYNEPQLVSGRWNGVFDNVREVKEFGFGGELLRRFELTYEEAQQWKDRWLVKLCKTKKMFEGASLVPGWRADYAYDTAALTTYAQLPGMWDANTPAQRGNLTSAVINSNAKDPSLGINVATTMTYDVAGNQVTVTTANGNATPDDPNDGVTTTAYAPDFQYAYATSVTSPAPDPSGGNGSASPFTTFADYDFNTGLVKSQTDANGQTTVYTYTDPGDPPNSLNRLRKVESPDGGFTTYEYGDGPSEFFTRTRKAIDAARRTDNFQYSDALGRATRSFAYDGSDAARTWVVSDTEYDVMGRVKRKSNPYFVPQLGANAPAGTVKWSESQYDPIGRVESLTAADGSTTNTYYDGTRILSKDPAGNQRICVTNSLGQLTDVWEVRGEDAATEHVDFPNHPDVTAGYHTHYAYDLLGNLIRIEQGTQTRFYAYDSLSRLIRARNPEQGVNPDLALNPQLLRQPSDNNSWSTLYEYDLDGNLKKKIDARNVQTTNEYDGLNRAVHRRYSAPELYAATPGVDYYYDGTGLPSVDPTTGSLLSAPQNAKGRQTAMKSAVAETLITDFDSAGRVKTQLQVIDPLSFSPKAYRMEYAYDLAGNTVSQKYPSGRVVVTESDAAGRVAGVRNQGQTDYYVGGDAGGPNAIQYDAHGAVSSMRLGNGLWEHTEFNAKLQPKLFGLGATAADPNVLKIEYAFGVIDPNGTLNAAKNNGNLQSQTISVPGASPFVQSYTYDALNRLETAEEKVGSSSKWKQAYHYDRFGNRTLDAGTTYPALLDATNNPSVSPANNRINSAGHSYDAAGNLLCDALHQCGNATMSAESPSLVVNHAYLGYDAENRMVRAGANGAGDSNGGTSYAYDGDGRRVKKTDAGSTTVYVYDTSGQMLAEYASQPPAAQFGRLYVTTDALGTPRVATDKDRVARERHDYLPFGDAVPVATRSGIAGYGADILRQKFTGKERDPETQLDFFQARYYSSAHGRFTTPDEFPGGAAELFTTEASTNPTFFADPLNPQSLNKYQYAYNNPLRYVDPTGHSVTDFFDLIGSYFMTQANPEKAAREGRVETPFGVMNAEEYAYWWWKTFNENTMAYFEGVESFGNDYLDGFPLDFGVAEWGKQVNASANGKTDVLGLSLATLNMASSVSLVGEGMSATVGTSTVASGGRAIKAAEELLLNCFVAGTPVHTIAGLRPIEEIKPGDTVLSWNQDTRELEYKLVLRTFTHSAEELVAVSVEGDSSPIVTTPGHPFFVRRAEDDRRGLGVDVGGAWMSTAFLRAGDEVRRPGGEWARVASVGPLGVGAEVYNFEVADDHDYFVGVPGVLVHNQSKAISWITPGSLGAAEEKAVMNTVSHIGAGTKPTGALAKKWGTTFYNNAGDLPGVKGAGGYTEYRVSSTTGKNVQRVVKSDLDNSLFYTWTHYGQAGNPAFVRIR